MTLSFDDINQGLMSFIDDSPTAFNCVANICSLLTKAGFERLSEKDEWNIKKGSKYFVVRNDSSIIAGVINDPSDNKGFNIVASHSDSPGFSLKPGSEISENGYIKLNTNGYGGMILYSWLDRPLSLAGRVVIKDDDGFKSEIIHIDQDLLVIPSQAIHINREVNDRNNLNPQVDLLPIIGLADKTGQVKELLANYVNYQSVCDYDLFLYTRAKATYVGINNEFIVSPRLDNLACAYNSLMAFLTCDDASTNRIYCCFDSEEIGSLTQNGADSTFLNDFIIRSCEAMKVSVYPVLSRSFLVSADNGHALHPNAATKSDLTNKVKLNEGVVIKHHVNYTTNALTSSVFKDICDKAKVKWQDFTCRSDMRNGSTLGGISLSHVSVSSVDIGLPQLAMHAAVETMGASDSLFIYQALKEFYKTSINIKM
ncbi:MAG: M18 family aminopeptidase [Erysipelotrichaceae bacterium]|nr:M18 family aminopeptidase [Erysipelotrichaceae bacterium]